MDDKLFFEWYWNEATDQEKTLVGKVGQFEDEYFQDMLFRRGTHAYDLLRVRTEKEGEELLDVAMSVPEELEYFNMELIRYKVIDLGEVTFGSYNHTEKLFCIAPDYIDNDAAILHEMIHMHEGILNELPLHFHDMMFWSLYQGLKEKRSDIDSIITNHAHILNESLIYETGGLHDIVFLLKSLDLDISKGYPLGTVFGYDKSKEIGSV